MSGAHRRGWQIDENYPRNTSPSLDVPKTRLDVNPELRRRRRLTDLVTRFTMEKEPYENDTIKT